MANRFHVKKGDEVVVVGGADKGRRGKVLAILAGQERVIVEGLRMVKRHTRRNQQQQQGSIIEREGSIHLSKVMEASRYDARAARRGGAAQA